MKDISSCYTDEIIQDNGIDYNVLDTTKLDFSDAKFGKKTAVTKVRQATHGEEIITDFGTTKESRYTCKGDEAIFINSPTDVYVPRDKNGNPNGWETLVNSYEFISSDGEDKFFIPKTSPSRILIEAIQKPTCIKDAWGPGSHQFLAEGATLKQVEDRATGINKQAFDQTWSITDRFGKIQNQQGQGEARVR